MRIRNKSILEKLGISILAFIVALALSILGRPITGDDSPYLPFFSALAWASWYGGLAPGILTALLGAIASAVLFVPLITPQGTVDVIHCMHICVYSATGVFISVLMNKLHRAIDRSTKAEQELENKVRERTAQLAQANSELRSEKNKLLGILDRMREAVYIVNPEYGIEYVNPAMEQEFGKVDGRKCYEYMEGSGATVCSRCRNQEVFEGKSFIQEWESPTNSKVYDCFDTPIVIGEGVQCKLRIMHDITGLKKAESELKAKHEQIQQLSSELLTAQESERLRVSRELHDELGQSLTLIKLKIGLLEMDLPESPRSLKNMCEDASKHVDQAIENMRRLSRDLSPLTIETLGITRALRRLAEDFGKTGKIQITAEIDDVDDILPLQSGILLYRILQEGLNNIVKHSGAGTASVTLERTDDGIQVNLQDDGRGVNFANNGRIAEAEKGGLGLMIMSERVRTLGGILVIQRLNDVGTGLRFVIPIRNRETENGELSGDSGR